MAAEHTVQMGRRIREQREKAGLTQAELAALIPGKADGTQVSKWERGLHRPGDDTLAHIAKALKCPVAAFHVDPPAEGTGDLMAAFSPTDARLTQIEQLLEQVLARLPDGALPAPEGELGRRAEGSPPTDASPVPRAPRRAAGSRANRSR